MIPGIIQIARKGTSLHMRVCVSVLVGGGGGLFNLEQRINEKKPC